MLDGTDEHGRTTPGFTTGLFSGAASMFDLVNNWMNLKDRLRMRNAADEVGGLIIGGASLKG